MQFPRAILLGIAGLAALAAAVVLLSPAQADWNNQSRVDAGAPIEVRLNEPFDVAPAGFYEDLPAVEAQQFWWDLNAAEDTTPRDGIFNNDQDEFNLAFTHPGIGQLGVRVFTLWINYSDGKLANGTRQVTVVENQPPQISSLGSPTGTVDEPVTFTVTVSDPDSLESTLLYEWDFDVGTDSGSDGIADNDVDSTNKTGVSHVYRSEGTYTAKLTVTDDFGAASESFITVVVARPPGVCEREVADVGQYFTENVTIRKQCWASYHMKVTAGRLYQYDVDVSNDAPVYVMVLSGRAQYDAFRFRTSSTPYVPEWSTVTSPTTHASVQFRPTEDGDLWIAVDNGFLFQLGSGKPAVAVVTVQDADRSNLLANIPIALWIVLGAIGLGVAGFFGGRAYLAGAEARRQERERRAVEQHEKASAKSELDQFLQNPEASVQRRMAPPPPAAGPPPSFAAPAPAPIPAPAPRPAGPQAPPGYTPRPAVAARAPAPAPPAFGPRPAGPQPPPGYAPAPVVSPGPAAGPQPPAASLACPNCGTPTEAGWQVCPNCGGNL